MRQLIFLLLACACGMGEAKPIRFLSFNVFGDWSYMSTYACERDAQQAQAILKRQPDIVAFQEVTTNFWNSRLFSDLTGFKAVGRIEAWCNYTPLAYRAERFDLLDSGAERFHVELDKSKGFTWAVLKDRLDGQEVITFSTHFWFKRDGAASDYIRVVNVRDIEAKVSALRAKHPDAAVFGGGDVNSLWGDASLAEFAKFGYVDVQPTFPEKAKDASYHNILERIPGTTRWKGFMPGEGGRPAGVTYDHVFFRADHVKPVSFSIDTEEDFRDASDHFPLVVDFEAVR